MKSLKVIRNSFPKQVLFDRRIGYFFILLFFLILLLYGHLILTHEKVLAQSINRPKEIAKPGATIYISQAQFLQKKGRDGRMHPVPGPARLEILTRTKEGWGEEIIEDPDSNVFHKAAWFVPHRSEPGILTIGATRACLRIWRKKEGQWQSETLWNPSFGGKFDRLRDFEAADINGDGINEIAVATHDQGVVAVISWEDGQWKATEICRNPDTFVHEIEFGDIDGDRILEIFTTPSRPNMLDGSIQPGSIDMWQLKNGTWKRQIVESFESRHVKEILCSPIEGEKNPVLFASLEGEHFGQTHKGDTTRIRMYRFDQEKISHTDIASLPGKLCRFLTLGDTDGDGRKEVIASTRVSGIWKLIPPSNRPFKKKWEKSMIAENTSGFEHATFLFDSDGDGKEEIYVASDDQKELRCYRFNGKDYSVHTLKRFTDDIITFNLTAHNHSKK